MHDNYLKLIKRKMVLDQFNTLAQDCGIDPFSKNHKLVHNGGFPNFEALYCSLNIVNSTEIS